MQVARLDHVNIRTRRLAETVRFYADILGLTEGDPPPNLDAQRVRWMFDAAGAPVVHISSPGSLGHGEEADDCTGPTGGLDHIAFALVGYEEIAGRIDRAGLPRRENRVEAIGLTQLFVHDPNGVLIELNVRDEEPAG